MREAWVVGWIPKKHTFNFIFWSITISLERAGIGIFIAVKAQSSFLNMLIDRQSKNNSIFEPRKKKQHNLSKQKIERKCLLT
jgi:hypothetical protein